MFFANASKLFSFFFSEKNDEDPILADFLKKMATAWDGCTAAQQINSSHYVENISRNENTFALATDFFSQNRQIEVFAEQGFDGRNSLFPQFNCCTQKVRWR